MAKDVPTGAGPLWIGSRLSFKAGQSDGRPVMEVAPACGTEDFPCFKARVGRCEWSVQCAFSDVLE